MATMDTLAALASAPLAFRNVVVLYPIVTAAHVAEEWRGFPVWAKHFASPRYTHREYVITHVATLLVATFGAALARTWPGGWPAVVFFSLLFGPSIACNALFHIGASMVTRSYCPGAITSAVLYLPASVVVVGAALRDGVVGPRTLALSMLLAAALHVAEVGHNVFKRW